MRQTREGNLIQVVCARVKPGKLMLSALASLRFLAISLTVMVSMPLFAKDNRENANSSIQTTFRVNNQVGLSAHSLEVVKRELLRIAGEAGIEITWLDCTINGSTAPLPEKCKATVGKGEFVLNIRTFKDQEKGRDSRQAALGHSWVTARGGVYSSIFADVVYSLPVPKELQDKILGHAAAHEFGHLLLGPNAHAKQGIMRTNWDNRDWAAMNVAMLHFSPEESRKLRERIQASLNGKEGRSE